LEGCRQFSDKEEKKDESSDDEGKATQKVG